MKKTWKELKAEGVKRCCAMFTDGKQCRARASENFGFSWCEKHGPTMKMWEDYNLKLIEVSKGVKRK
jgi:hypothetical protein